MQDQDQVVDPTFDDVGAGAETAPEPSSASENGSEAETGADLSSSVQDRLRAAYAAGEGERSTIIPIAPGRYRDLAAEYRPIDWELRRRLQRKAQRSGDTGAEAEADFQAVLVADACKAIVMRPAPGKDYVPLHTLLEQFGDVPIRFDTRLAEVLGMTLIGGESEGDICRLVFGDRGAFEVHMTQLTTWSTQVLPDDEEDEGEGDPT
jgi:hypothetical protein